MKSSELREAYLSFFEERGHLRVPSASLIPAPEDTSTLLTIAGSSSAAPTSARVTTRIATSSTGTTCS